MGVIEGENLWKVYRMGDVEVKALHGVDISVDEGEFVSIMGPSGSGKSTLMHILGLLDSPSRGNVRVKGKEVGEMTEAQRAAFRLKTTGFVFQFYSLLSGFMAYENVYLPMSLMGCTRQKCVSRAREVLQQVGLGDRLKHKPNELSGGQRQRVAIARAIVNDPDIILADEPNSQLDTETSKQIMNLFRELSEQGRTVVVVNHEPELGEMADRKIILEDGEISD